MKLTILMVSLLASGGWVKSTGDGFHGGRMTEEVRRINAGALLVLFSAACSVLARFFGDFSAEAPAADFVALVFRSALDRFFFRGSGAVAGAVSVVGAAAASLKRFAANRLAALRGLPDEDMAALGLLNNSN